LIKPEIAPLHECGSCAFGLDLSRSFSSTPNDELRLPDLHLTIV
jgi:hypothetical protein